MKREYVVTGRSKHVGKRVEFVNKVQVSQWNCNLSRYDFYEKWLVRDKDGESFMLSPSSFKKAEPTKTEFLDSIKLIF